MKGCELVVFEASWFVYLAATGDHAFGIAFMAPDHPSQPPGPERFNAPLYNVATCVSSHSTQGNRSHPGAREHRHPS
jgi:hypothetical protein